MNHNDIVIVNLLLCQLWITVFITFPELHNERLFAFCRRRATRKKTRAEDVVVRWLGYTEWNYTTLLRNVCMAGGALGTYILLYTF